MPQQCGKYTFRVRTELLCAFWLCSHSKNSHPFTTVPFSVFFNYFVFKKFRWPSENLCFRSFLEERSDAGAIFFMFKTAKMHLALEVKDFCDLLTILGEWSKILISLTEKHTATITPSSGEKRGTSTSAPKINLNTTVWLAINRDSALFRHIIYNRLF